MRRHADGDDTLDWAGSSAGRPTKIRRVRQNVGGDDANGGTQGGDDGGDDGEDGDAGEPEFEPRSCENCRRCKLKCSRSRPCSKCVLRGVHCVYEHTDKKRGPRPGYMEELYRRMDALENMLLGQSLMRVRDDKSPVPTTLQGAVECERDRLEQMGSAYHQQQQQSQQEPHRRPISLSPPSASQHPPTSGSSAASRDRPVVTASGHLIDPKLAPEHLSQLSEIYRHQIQPWLPFVREEEIRSRIARSTDVGSYQDSLLQAVVAATCPHAENLSIDHGQHFAALQNFGCTKLLQTADIDNLRIALILQFFLFGKGQFTSWGLVTYPAQVAVSAGLHLEDHHLTPEHRGFRVLVGFGDTDQTWTGKETVRRLFWTIFIQDHFAAMLSGGRPSFSATIIRRLLPCDGQRWQDDQPVHTHEFVPAAVAVQVQVFADNNIGGFAYLVEATEIQAMIMAFVRQPKDVRTGPQQDMRAPLQEFLNLDLMLTNWKARLPPRHQQASYDENGYMDHNITLAHLTHNTTGILLYHWPYTLYNTSAAGSDLQTALFSHIHVVKQAAKEIAKICTRFLLRRRYLVSPQFTLCQFIAARALLVYSHWMLEPLDEDFQTLYSSLTESSQRWQGRAGNQDGNSRSPLPIINLATLLQLRLAMDMKRPDAIDLTTPAMQLLKEMDHGDVANSDPVSNSGAEASLQGPQSSLFPNREDIELGGAVGTDSGVANVTSADLYTGVDSDLEQALSLLFSTQTGSLGTRIFSWHDSPELAAPSARYP
ncbi:hypothetical protein S7711_09882 [Stachybotrys chartarum IBT 7711]|uniref:Zn(2)-C6 fungal-type domain-containing protein n=1 Tax=Stachybotrys chartarum (strain CBS 109288 / IBT 7711) TaxID=1280523 RepID=A0A084AZI5_STACB|nr:hypothetical protein S7711_09882 [Stachybotrys chartarum IBT 7711]